VLAVVQPDQLRRILCRVVDPFEFLSRYGLRSLSRAHADEPFVIRDAVVHYEPAEAESKLKGGNSNWRGPVWFPTTFLMIESLRKIERALGKEIELSIHDEKNGHMKDVTLSGFAEDLANRLIRIFVPDSEGYRPANGARGSRKAELFARDPHWKDLVLFHEYFNPETGEGLGASHQTGWTGLVASLIDEWRGSAKRGAGE
jgi:hypothetical protein